MDSTQGRLRAVHLTTILVVGGLVAMVTSSCGSNSEPEAPTDGQDAAVLQPDTSVTPDGEQPDTGHFIDAGPCIPQPIDCTDKCGPVRDACSGEVKLCGGCPTGEVCDLQLHTCGVPKKQCSDFGAECGRVKTSCGQYITCGSCPTGKECNPDTNKCVPAENVTCQDLGYECGLAWLGNGDPSAKTNCGTCQSPTKSRCNSAFNVCEPACVAPWKVAGLTGPQVIAAKKAFCDAARQNKGVECGIISDGCGGTIDCTASQGFSCPAGQGCGVRGVANRCEPFPTPPECETLGKNCGTIISACDGKPISCGVCGVAGEVCNDNGICGPPCKSQTCAQALPVGQACGAPSDGCKGTLNCTCPGGGKCVTGGTCCQPKTCAQLKVPAGSCGRKLDDGCGGKVDCPCVSGQCTATTGTIAACCSPKTCANYPGQCGKNLDNGCGGTIDCGCSGGGSCIVGGPPGTTAPDGTAGTCCAETNCPAGSCNTSVSSVCISGKNITCDTCVNNQVCNGTSCCAPASTNCGNQCGIVLDPGCGLPTVNCGCTLPFTCNGNVCTCTPLTCSDPSLTGKCGTFANGCNGSLNCDPCTGGQVCNNNTQACCTPKTCAADYAGQCGFFTDGCGNTLNCTNVCSPGLVCNNNTQTCCAPKTCAADYPGQCGIFSNGCGGNLNCNNVCIGGQVCNGNTQTCCTPKTCNGDYPGQCGVFSDGCGGNLDCTNSCPGGQVCNNSTQSCCTQKKCAVDYAGQCGTFSDGCGGSLNCTNVCVGGQVCNVNTQTCCTKKTCAINYPGQCGSFTDGCGGNVSCGCTGFDTCGALTPGQCGCKKKTLADCVTAGPLNDGCGGIIVCPA